MEERWTPLPPEVWQRLQVVIERPSPITPAIWRRLLEAFDAGVPVVAACQHAGIPLETWLAECERVPEFRIEAEKVAISGIVAAARFLQQTGATEWRLEFMRAMRPDLFWRHAGARERARS